MPLSYNNKKDIVLKYVAFLCLLTVIYLKLEKDFLLYSKIYKSIAICNVKYPCGFFN